MRYTYQVTIRLRKPSSYTKKYKVAHGYLAGDTFVYKKSVINLTLVRSVRYQNEDVMLGGNSILSQIRKALLFYVLTNAGKASVSGIEIVRATKRTSCVIYKKEYTEQEQSIPVLGEAAPSLKKEIAAPLFGERKISEIFQTLANHWLNGLLCEESPFGRFLSFWNAFEQWTAYFNVSNDQRVKGHLFNARGMLINPNLAAIFPNALNLVHGLSFGDVYNNLRWDKYIYNILRKTNGDALYYKYFVLANDDERLVEIMKKLLPLVRSKVSDGIYHNIHSSIDNKGEEIRRDGELLAVLLCGYAYNCRCELVHGRWVPQQPILPTGADHQLEFLNNILGAVVRDLVENFSELYSRIFNVPLLVPVALGEQQSKGKTPISRKR